MIYSANLPRGGRGEGWWNKGQVVRCWEQLGRKEKRLSATGPPLLATSARGTRPGGWRAGYGNCRVGHGPASGGQNNRARRTVLMFRSPCCTNSNARRTVLMFRSPCCTNSNARRTVLMFRSPCCTNSNARRTNVPSAQNNAHRTKII